MGDCDTSFSLREIAGPHDGRGKVLGKQKSVRADTSRQLASHVATARVADVWLSVEPYVPSMYT